MNKNGNFAVVRRPSSAVEKAVPGAKRILSDMVADALILAKKKPSPRIIVVDDEPDYLELITEFIKCSYKDATVLTFGDPEKALKELFQRDPNLLLLDTNMPKLSGCDILKILTRKMAAYPILVMGSSCGSHYLDLSETYPNLNAKILDRSFDLETFSKALEAELKIPRDIPTQNEIISLLSRPLNRRGKLLVVDDEEGIRESMRVLFENEYDLFIAGDGVAAIELAQQHDIDVVVTNRNMPRMSGYDVLERLKYMKPDIKVIMMSGMDTTDSRRMAFQLGACDYIPKPFDTATIRAAVSKAMQRRKLESEITVARKTPSSHTDKINDQPLQTRPLRIVMVDDDDATLELNAELIREWFKNAEFVTFTSPAAGLRELEQREPDLLITGVKMPKLDGEILVGMLVRRMKAKNVNYPILVLSGYESAQQWVREYASRGMNVRFLSKKDAYQDNGQFRHSIEEMLNRQHNK